MKPPSIMIIAGEASGDTLAAELVIALRREITRRHEGYPPDLQPVHTGLEPRFFGAGGARMKEAGVNLAFDLTQHSIIGIPGLQKYLKLRQLFHQLLRLAQDRQPDIIIGVDFGGFNLRFGHAIRKRVRNGKMFNNWRPKLVQFVSPQVWASRAGRAFQIEEDYDLLLSIFPFEKEWYAQRAPRLRVEFVGHPMVDRFANALPAIRNPQSALRNPPSLLLLPGSRRGELQRHLPVMLEAVKRIQTEVPTVHPTLVVPNSGLAQLARSLGAPDSVTVQMGNLPEALRKADAAIASTGTVTMECALFGVPAVTLYKTSWPLYQLGKRIVKVKSLTMPNLLAGEAVYPEFIQDDATPENLARAAVQLLTDVERRDWIRRHLAQIVASLGGPGATTRAAQAVATCL